MTQNRMSDSVGNFSNNAMNPLSNPHSPHLVTQQQIKNMELVKGVPLDLETQFYAPKAAIESQ